MQEEIPLYLLTGFLEAGKTTFIQQTLEDERFNSGEKTLLLLCEEGEEEIDLSRLPYQNVTIRVIEDQAELTKKRLRELIHEVKPEQIMVEYNGMWMIRDLVDVLPPEVVIGQEICVVDATTIMAYNANMRQLVYDKFNTAELVFFNRCPDKQDIMPLHQLVRAVSRSANISYEYQSGYLQYDEIEDPLPFDTEADVIEIEDRDYALWFRDLMDDMKKYAGKTIKFKGVVAHDASTPEGVFVVGRHVMTCCAEDIQYCGLACDWKGAGTLKTNDWVILTAKLSVGKHRLYSSKGPYFTALEVVRTSAPDQPVASFF